MLDFLLCTFLTILLSVMLLFYYTVVHAQDTVRRRNLANELTEAQSKIRNLESDLVRKSKEVQSKVRNLESELDRKKKEMDELRKELERTDNKSRKDLEISLSASGSPDIPDYASSPSSPDIMVTDTGSMYDKSPYSDADIKINQEEVAAGRRRSSLMSHGSSRRSSNASVQVLSKVMFTGRGSLQEAKLAKQMLVRIDDDLWESEKSPSSRRGSLSADQMSLMSVDTELVTLMPPEAENDRRVSWPRVRVTRRRHSTFPPENLNNILEN